MAEGVILKLRPAGGGPPLRDRLMAAQTELDSLCGIHVEAVVVAVKPRDGLDGPASPSASLESPPSLRRASGGVGRAGGTSGAEGQAAAKKDGAA